MFIADKLYSLVQERMKLIAKLKQAELEKKRILEEAQSERQIIIEEAKKEAKSYMRTSQDLAKDKSEAIIKKANKSVMAILASGDRQIEKERTALIADTKDYIIDMAIKLNERVFGKHNINREYLEFEFEKIK